MAMKCLKPDCYRFTEDAVCGFEKKWLIITSFSRSSQVKLASVDKLLGALGETLWEPEQATNSWSMYILCRQLFRQQLRCWENLDYNRAYPGKGSCCVLKGLPESHPQQNQDALAETFQTGNVRPRVDRFAPPVRTLKGSICTHARMLLDQLIDLRLAIQCDMDYQRYLERIHRYGQRDTAQVYNLVLGDTIEGKIYLLLPTIN